MCNRKLFAELVVDDELAVEENLGTIDYVEREFGWIQDSGIELRNAVIADEDEVDIWQRYLNYLVDWAMLHRGDEFEGMSPASFDEWKSNEGCE